MMNSLLPISPKFSPIIIIGMHRAGTSLIARTMDRLGVFCGAKLDRNHEAVFFRNLNEWLFRISGASWDHPEPVRTLVSNSSMLEIVTEYISFMVSSAHIRQYLGLRGYLQHRSLINLNFPWCWKEPRNTFTLPIWLKLFPEAKMVCINRHGVDVAQSLLKRGEEYIKLNSVRFRKNKWFYNFIMKKSGFTDTIRCSSLQGGLMLWDEYMARTTQYIDALGSQILAIEYENFLNQPVDHIKALSDFCDLESSDRIIEMIAAGIKSHRAYAYRTVPALVTFAENCREILNKYGYKA